MNFRFCRVPIFILISVPSRATDEIRAVRRRTRSRTLGKRVRQTKRNSSHHQILNAGLAELNALAFAWSNCHPDLSGDGEEMGIRDWGRMGTESGPNFFSVDGGTAARQSFGLRIAGNTVLLPQGPLSKRVNSPFACSYS